MKTIHLYGALKDDLGPKLRLDVVSAAEVVRAIVTTRPAAEATLREGAFILVRRTVETKSGRIAAKDIRAAIEDEAYQLDMETMTMGLGRADLHIIPVVKGEGGRGIGKVVLGVAMIGGAWALAPAALTAGAVGSTVMSSTAISLMGMSISVGTLGVMGALMALGGISQMLAKAPEAAKSQDRNESYIFSGPANVGSQSNAVPVIHGGPIRVGSVTVSSAITTQRGGGIVAGSGFGGIKGTIVGQFVNQQ